jgi:hypothetical protein
MDGATSVPPEGTGPAPARAPVLRTRARSSDPPSGTVAGRATRVAAPPLPLSSVPVVGSFISLSDSTVRRILHPRR